MCCAGDALSLQKLPLESESDLGRAKASLSGDHSYRSTISDGRDSSSKTRVSMPHDFVASSLAQDLSARAGNLVPLGYCAASSALDTAGVPDGLVPQGLLEMPDTRGIMTGMGAVLNATSTQMVPQLDSTHTITTPCFVSPPT